MEKTEEPLTPPGDPSDKSELAAGDETEKGPSMAVAEVTKDTFNTLPGDTTAATPMTKPVVEITNRRYQSNCFWGGPKGLDYGLLRGRLPIQLANYYPDANSTYFVGQFNMPKGAYLTIQGHYGHLRYFSLTVANNLPGGVQGGGTFLRDDQIEPDAGSTNPFVPTNGRNVPHDQRSYTVYIRQGTSPEEAPANTLYTGTDSDRVGIHLALRSYLPDVGFDGTGNVGLQPSEDSGTRIAYGLPEITLTLTLDEDGKTIEQNLTGEKLCKFVRASKAQQPQEYPTNQWLKLVAESWDPTNAPALSAPTFQRFWDMNYSVTGRFIIDPVERVLTFPPTDNGAYLTNPDTVYMVALFSLSFGELVVIKGKMPSFPATKHGQDFPENGTQVRYWSLTAGATAPSGFGWATVFDEEIPLDQNGHFTIVMSRAENRPKNAVRTCGVKWIEFGGGEGHYIGARNWVNSVYIRYMASEKGKVWPNSPLNIPIPSKKNPAPMDAAVMGPYYPRGQYMSKEEFEIRGTP